MIIYCAYCVSLEKGSLHEDHEAITIANGTATCEDHLKYISHLAAPIHANVIRFMNRKAREDASS